MHEDNGIYSIKSGYYLVHALRILEQPSSSTSLIKGTQSNSSFWKILWKLPISPKYQFFIWRIDSNACPTNAALFRRGCVNTPVCFRCNDAEETVNHLFLDSARSKLIWQMSMLGLDFDAAPSIPLYDWIVDWFLKAPDKQLIVLSICILWQIWQSRN